MAATLLGAAAFSVQDPRKPSSPPEVIWETCEEMHDGYVKRFASSPGFGMSRMVRPPMLDRSGVLDFGRTRYSIESIELVGLLLQETPVVHVPQWHGSAVSAGFKSRDLTDFEKESLAALRAGDDMTSHTSERSGVLLCMGSLRANASCVNCHKAKKAGDLLGAFTYRLRRIDGGS
jgi:hypothetical protein